MVRYLVALATFGLATLRVPVLACETGFQSWKTDHGTVCLADAMVAYLSCLEVAGGGQITVEKDNSGANSKTFKVAVAGGGSGAIVKANGTVNVDTSNAEIAVRTIKQQFDPNNSTNCFHGAFGGKDGTAAHEASRGQKDEQKLASTAANGKSVPVSEKNRGIDNYTVQDSTNNRYVRRYPKPPVALRPLIGPYCPYYDADDPQWSSDYSYLSRGCSSVLAECQRLGRPCKPIDHVSCYFVWEVDAENKTVVFPFECFQTGDECEIDRNKTAVDTASKRATDNIKAITDRCYLIPITSPDGRAPATQPVSDTHSH